MKSHVHDGEVNHEEECIQCLIPALAKQFYHLGWVTGTGGGISIRQGETIYIAPSGVQKERMKPEDMFQYRCDGTIANVPLDATLKPSQCTPLFFACYNLAKAGACIHTHSRFAVLVTLMYEDVFSISNMEMIKGIRRGTHGDRLSYFDRLVVPIIENTAHERDLEASLSAAIQKYPEAVAVLVRRHGIYVWGKSWQEAKTMTECIDYLLQLTVEMKQLGIKVE